MHGKPGSKNPTLPADCSAFPSFSSAFAVGVCCLGVSAFLTQLTLMRELLDAFPEMNWSWGSSWAIGCS